MAKMNYEQRMVFLRYVADCVAADPSLLRDVMSAMHDGIQQKLEQANQLRVDAEASVCWLLGKVPKATLAKEPAMAVKAKKVVVESGMFAGTIHANELAAEIMVGEEQVVAHDKERKTQAEAEQEAHRQELREQRERQRQKKKPVSTITAQAVACDVAAGEATLTPFKVASGKDGWNLHAWVIVVDEADPCKAQESSMLYVGNGVEGRDTYASEELAMQAIEGIHTLGNQILDEKDA